MLESIASFAINFLVSTAVSMVLSWLFPTNIKGPRLKDLAATGQGYGPPIPTVYGSASVPGSIIWASDLIEKKHKEGGKGGGSSVTTYTYSQHVALAVCEGPAQITKIWAGGMLIWDINNNPYSSGGKKSKKAVIKYQDVMTYSGTDTQVVNSLIESYKGVGKTSAYRGTCYVVLKNLQLEKWGNRLPPFQFEVQAATLVQNPSASVDYGYINEGQKFIGKDGNIWSVYGQSDGTGPSVVQEMLWYKTDLDKQTTSIVARTYVVGDVVYGPGTGGNGGCYVSAHNEYWITFGYTGDYGQGLAIYDADTLALKKVLNDWLGSHRYRIYYHAPTDIVCVLDENVGIGLTAYTGARNPTTGEPTYLYYKTYPDFLFLAHPWIYLDEYHYAMCCATETSQLQIVEALTGVVIKTFTLSGYGNPTDFIFDYDNYRMFAPGALSSGTGYIYYIDFPKSDTAMFGSKTDIDWVNGAVTVVSYSSSGPSPDEAGWSRAGEYYVAMGHQIGEGYSFYLFDVATGNFIKRVQTTEISGYTPTNTTLVFEELSDAGGVLTYDTGTERVLYVPLFDSYMAVGTGVRLSDIVSDICTRAGLTTGQLDVTDLSDQYVDGYVIGNPMSARDSLDPLRAAYFFDGAESGGKIKFKMRGSNVVATIPEIDLGAVNGDEPGAEPFAITRGTEEEIPYQVDIHYIRKDSEYEVGVQHARVMNTTSSELRSMDLAVVLSDFRARDVAEVTLHTTRLERTSYQFATTRKWTHIEPMDVIEVEYDGSTYHMRITEKNEGGGIYTFKGVPDDQSYYVDIGHYAETSGFYTASNNYSGGPVTQSQSGLQTIADTAKSYPRFLDLPPLLPSHDGLGIYETVTANKLNASDEWAGAINYVSLDGGVTYTEGTIFTSEAVVARTETALGDFAGGSGIFDFVNSVVLEVAGDIESITYDGMIAGLNLMLIGSEIIQFQNATYLGMATNGINKRYRISSLLRGRRGTEQHIGTHGTNDVCILLDTRVKRLVEPETRLGATIYRIGTVGEEYDDLSDISVTNTGVCLKPFSPVNMRGYKSAATSWDVLIDWNRRDRLARSLVDGSDIPMSEETERYDIEIYTSDFVTLKRTVIDNATTYYVYDNADQITDFGSEPSSFGVKIYQKSATVGRGFPGTAVITPV